MGRKGVSKRKPKQVKPKPLSDENAGAGETVEVQIAKNQPVRLIDAGKAFPPSKGIGNKSAERRKSPNKG